MTIHGDRVSQHLSAFLDNPRSMPSARGFLAQLDVETGLHKPSTTASEEARNDSNAAYLLTKDGVIAKQNFLALVEMDGTFSKVGPYFNASTPQGDPRDVDKALHRLRAQIQLKAITTTDRLAAFYPPGAVRSSNAALKGFLYVQQGLKDHYKAIKDEDFTKFVRSVPREDRYAMVGTTHLLIPSLRGRSDDIPQMSLDDLDSDEDEDDVTLSPSKLKAKHPSESNAELTSTNLTLRDLPDPEGQYALTGSALEAEIVPPRVYDGRRRLVPPHKYDTVNRDTLAIVETSICGWEMRKVNKLVTHLRIESIQLLDNGLLPLPSPSPSPPPSPTPAPKRKLATKRNDPAKRMRTRASSSTASSSTAKDDGIEGVIEEDEIMEVEDKKDPNPDGL
ncbi:hypothetical protein FA13DRAFT_1817357 [Coprinellus micaceus]|uniref:Uncharacterized protein n=1 Tax=Coprinellus micaceus TaxID=71717 RepID=A0A4Y7SW55_COPMI|nr:hypothetical protein FA13DRAFT_1817357 [Coprinellus micaceus]